MTDLFRHTNGEVIDQINCATCQRIAPVVALRVGTIMRQANGWDATHRLIVVTESMALSRYITREHRKEAADATRRVSVTRRRPAKAPRSRSRSRTTRLPR